MPRTRGLIVSSIKRAGVTALLGLSTASGLLGQTDWPTYNHDPSAMRYSPLTEINPKNVAALVRAWTFHSSEGVPTRAGGQRFQRNEATPIVVGNTLYVSTPYNRVVALEADSGKLIWKYDLNSGQ